MGQDMLKKGIINLLLLISVSILFFSCKEKYSNKKEYYKKQVHLWRNHNTYTKVYKLVNDSLNKWVDFNVGNYGRLKIDKISIDSNLYFNTDSSRFVTFILDLNVTDSTNTDSDYIEWLSGEKIKGQWYFWSHDNLILPREYTRKYYTFIDHPSFDQLSDIAIGHIIEAYLKEESNWPWERKKYCINEEYFDQLFVKGYLGLNLHTLDQIQKYKIWRQSMMYDTVERRGDYFTNINIDSLTVKGWDY